MSDYKWYEVKLRYDKAQDDGTDKRVLESYLVSAVSFSDAEQRIAEEMGKYISGAFEVEAAKKNSVSEIVYGEGTWYLAKVSFVTLDEHSGEEKVKTSSLYVSADGFDEALKTLNEHMKTSMTNWYVLSLAMSNILDVFDHDSKGTDGV